jgi:hypothetical protein
MIEVKNKVRVVEVDGEEQGFSEENPKILVSSHWNRDQLVVLEWPDVPEGAKLAVNGRDLEAAIRNAMNSVRF